MKFFILYILMLNFVYAQEATLTQLFNVQTVKVQESSQVKSLKSFGFVKVDDSLVYDVAPRFNGFVEVLYADTLYKKVKKGEALVKVYSPEVLKAKDEYANSVRYSKNKGMIHSSMTKLELLNIPKNEIDPKLKNRNFTIITSPASGYVFKKSLNNNSAFNAKQILFEIVNLDNVWVEVKIHQNQLQQLSKIDTFTITSPSLVKSYSAKNSGIYPELDAKEESFTLRLEVNNPNAELKPGMYMHVSMSQKASTYLTLPTTAVIRKNGAFYVFVVGEYEGEYEPLQIEVEVLNPDTYRVKGGLSEGDEVVNNALFMMDSDAQINALY